MSSKKDRSELEEIFPGIQVSGFSKEEVAELTSAMSLRPAVDADDTSTVQKQLMGLTVAVAATIKQSMPSGSRASVLAEDLVNQVILERESAEPCAVVFLPPTPGGGRAKSKPRSGGIILGPPTGGSSGGGGGLRICPECLQELPEED